MCFTYQCYLRNIFIIFEKYYCYCKNKTEMDSNTVRNLLLSVILDDGPNIIPKAEIIQNFVSSSRLGKKHRIVKKRNRQYFEKIIPQYTDSQFKEHFRLTRSTFQSLENIVGNHPSSAQYPNRAIPLSKKILFTLWLICKQESFLAVSDRFNIPTSSGHGIFKKVTESLAQLMPQFVKWPNRQQQQVSAQIFEELSGGIPNVVGAIDGCHIPIKQPVRNSTDYYNRKHFNSIILQGVCDQNLRFIDVFIGMPGKMDDARVFRNSPLFENFSDEMNTLFMSDQHLVGDSAYPLMVNVLTPFRDNGHQPLSHTRYNTGLGKIRLSIERALGMLKTKFCRLKYIDCNDVEFANKIIAAACMLHNFILEAGETLEEGMEYELDETENVTPLILNEISLNSEQKPNSEAVSKRLQIALSLQ